MGYVGASHIPEFKKDTHAEMLMAGGRAENGKGAEIVISDMTDLLKVIEFFAGEKTAGKSAPFEFPVASNRAESGGKNAADIARGPWGCVSCFCARLVAAASFNKRRPQSTSDAISRVF